MHKLVLKSIEHYKKDMKAFPKNIIFYRMGISDSQETSILENELLPLKAALYDNFKEKKPNLTFIIVNKKINDRFFSENLQNPEGVAITESVIKRDKAEFFLIS